MRVLITGVARGLGAAVARRLESSPAVASLVGVDVDPISTSGQAFQFVQTDLRSPASIGVLAEIDADVVVHCATRVNAGAGAVRKAHETNVSGTLNLLAGCGARVGRLVLKSTVAVYGHSSSQPSLLTESAATGRPPSSSAGRDLREVEQLVLDHELSTPGLSATVLRLGTVLSSGWDSPLGAYLALDPVPTVVGFDPRIQLLHEDDAVEAVCRAALSGHPGVYNVAGEGVLLLSQLIRLSGGRAQGGLPPLLGAWLQGQALRTLHGTDLPLHLVELLSAGQVLDCGALLEEFGWRPPRTTRQVAEEWVAGRRTAMVRG